MPPPGYEPFLATILDDPESDGPRMVYADWLEEHGDPRGEFIRIQLELARLSPDERAYDRLLGREQILRSANLESWQAEIPEWARPDCKFHRGFVNDVVIFPQWRSDFGPELSRRAPIERVRLQHVRDAMHEFAEGPFVKHLSRLAILDSHATAEDIRVLCRSESACGGLKSLELMGMGLEDTGALHLALCDKLTQLTRLELFRCEIGDRGAIRLASENYLTALRELDFSDNDLSDAAFVGVVNSTLMEQLTHFCWNSNNLSMEGLEALIESPNVQRLDHLELADNRLNDPAGRLLMEKFPNLRFLNVSTNAFTNGMMIQLHRFYGRRVRVGVPGE